MSKYGLLVLTKFDDVQYYLVPGDQWQNIWSDDGIEVDFDALSVVETEFFSTTLDLITFLREQPSISILEEASAPL